MPIPAPISATDRAILAQQFLDVQDALGRAILAVNQFWLDAPDVLKSTAGEADADTVVIQGPDVIRALGSLASRLDRCAFYTYRDRQRLDSAL